MTSPILEYATRFAERGFPIFPIYPPVEFNGSLVCSCGAEKCHPAKHPIGRLVPHGLNSATTELRMVRAWFGGYHLNVGMVTGARSGTIALDIDPRHSGDESLAKLERDHGSLP